MYPIQHYFDRETNWPYNQSEARMAVEYYNSLLYTRYFNFEKIFVTFDDENGLPDKSLFWKGLRIDPDVLVISATIKFDDLDTHCIYPNPANIIKQIPDVIDNIVVSGFHYWDCVDRVANYLYKNSYDVQSDPDLSEFFFYQYHLQGYISVDRDESIRLRTERLKKESIIGLRSLIAEKSEYPYILMI
jgi:hypothetical protein